MVETEQWPSFKRKNGSAFAAKPETTCYECGGKGHFARDCPKRKSQNKAQQQHRNYKANNPTHKPAVSPRANNPKYQKPKPGEPHERTRDGEREYWCEKCGRWTKNHKTETHTAKFDATKRLNRHQANAAKGESSDKKGSKSVSWKDDDNDNSGESGRHSAMMFTGL
jgi:hypothetical protein